MVFISPDHKWPAISGATVRGRYMGPGWPAMIAGEQWQKALSLLEMMPEARLKPNVISYLEPWISGMCGLNTEDRKPEGNSPYKTPRETVEKHEGNLHMLRELMIHPIEIWLDGDIPEHLKEIC